MNRQITDSEMIERMKAGDDTVFSDLYSLYFPMISTYIFRQGGEREDAQDIFSDAIIAIYQHARREDFFLTSSFRTYLFAICQRRWFNQLRQKHKRNEILHSSVSDTNLIEQENPLSLLEEDENREIIVTALNHVGERCKTLLTYYINDYSMKEIAEKQGLSSPEMVKKELYRCRTRLREYLEKQLNKQKKDNE